MEDKGNNMKKLTFKKDSQPIVVIAIGTEWKYLTVAN